MNKKSGIRVLALLVMMASMIVSSGCDYIRQTFLCNEDAYWDADRHVCVEPVANPENIQERERVLDKCYEEGGRWLISTDTCTRNQNYIKKVKESRRCSEEGGVMSSETFTCSIPAKNKKEARAVKCEEEGGEWIAWTRTCSIPTKNKEKAAANAAGDNAAATPGKLPDKSDTK
jgi:hypothetical protein